MLLSAMSESEARSLLAARQGTRTCIAYAVDADDRIRFRESKTRAPALALAGWALASLLVASGCLGFDSEDFETLDDLETEAWPSWSVSPPAPIEPGLAFEPSDPGDQVNSEFGRILVVVEQARDATPIAAVTVRIVSAKGEIEGWTDVRGSYEHADLAVGVYEVEVSFDGDTRRFRVGVEQGGRSEVRVQFHEERELLLGMVE